MRTVKFSYYNNIYEIDIEAFYAHSEFRLEDYQENQLDLPILLLSDFEDNFQIPPEVVNKFFNFFEGEEIEITFSDVFELRLLSQKYIVNILIVKTEDFIRDNREGIINEILTTRTLTQERERLVSEEIPNILSDDRLLLFSITELYRILSLYAKSHQEELTKLSREEKSAIIDFLYKVISKQGQKGTVLVNIFDKLSNDDYYQRKLIDNFYKLNNELATSKMIYLVDGLYRRNDELFEEQDRQRREMKEMKEKYEREMNELKEHIKRMETQAEEEHQRIAKEMSQKFEEENERNSKEIETLKKTIYKLNSCKFFTKKKRQ